MIHGLLEQMQPVVSDDEDDDIPYTSFVFCSQGGGDALPNSCKTVLICCPGAAAAYALTAFSLVPVQWSMEVDKETLLRAYPPPPRSPKFYVAAGGSVAVAILDAPVSNDLAYAWCDALLSAFGDAEVIVLGQIFRASWRVCGHEEKPEEPHLSGLWTASCGGPLDGSRLALLPPPNAVDGLPAALLSRCEATRRRCVLALALQDGAHLGAGCLRAFEGLSPTFARLSLRAADAKTPDYAEAIRLHLPPPALSIYS